MGTIHNWSKPEHMDLEIFSLKAQYHLQHVIMLQARC